MKSLTQQKGVSLVGVVAASGIAIALMAAITTSLVGQWKQSVLIERKSSANEIWTELTSNLKDVDICSFNFGGLNPKKNNSRVKIQKEIDCGTNCTKTSTLYEKGEMAKTQVKIKAIRFGSLSTDESYSGAWPSGEGQAFLRIELSLMDSSSGLTEISKSYPLNLLVEDTKVKRCAYLEDPSAGNSGRVKTLLDGPYVISNGTGSGTFDFNDLGLSPGIEIKSVLLYGHLDNAGPRSAFIKYKHPGHSNYKTLVDSDRNAKYPNSNSFWVPLDDNGRLNWKIEGNAAGMQRYTLRVQGYEEVNSNN